MSHIRLIISDIDGTILNDHHQIDPQLASLIPDLKREKIPFVLASARSPKGMAPIAKELGIRLSYGLLQWSLDPKRRAGSV